jgi:hypothetical protein
VNLVQRSCQLRTHPNPELTDSNQNSLNIHDESEEKTATVGITGRVYGAQHCEPCLALNTRSSNRINADDDNQTASTRTDMASELLIFNADRSDCMSEFTDIDTDSVSSVDPMWSPNPQTTFILQPGVLCNLRVTSYICCTAALMSTHTYMQRTNLSSWCRLMLPAL